MICLHESKDGRILESKSSRANPLKSDAVKTPWYEFSLASNEYQMSQQKCSATPRLVFRKKNKNKKEKLKKISKIQKTQTHFSNNLQLVLIVSSTLIFLKYITSSIESSQRVLSTY